MILRFCFLSRFRFFELEPYFSVTKKTVRTTRVVTRVLVNQVDLAAIALMWTSVIMGCTIVRLIPFAKIQVLLFFCFSKNNHLDGSFVCECKPGYEVGRIGFPK